MVDEQFCILAEQLVKQVLVPLRTEGNIAHGEYSILLKFLGSASTYAPEVCEGLMRPHGLCIYMSSARTVPFSPPFSVPSTMPEGKWRLLCCGETGDFTTGKTISVVNYEAATANGYLFPDF